MFLKKIVLALVAFIIFAMPWGSGVFGVISIGPLGLLALVGVLAFLAAMAFLLFGQQGLGKAPVPWDISVTLLALFVALNFASMGWADNPSRANSQSIDYAQLLVFVWLLVFLRSEKGALSILLHAYLLGAFFAIFQVVSTVGPSQLLELDARLDGLNRTANGFALTLTLAIPIALYLFQRGRPMVRWLYLSYIPAAAFLVFLSGSRTGFLLLLIVAGVAFWSILKAEEHGKVRFSRKGALFSVGAAVVLAVVVAPHLTEQFQRQAERIATVTQDETAGGRTHLWGAAIAAFRENPVLGLGSGGIREAMPDYVGHDGLFVSLPITGRAVHNTYLVIAADTGTVGLLLYLAAIGVVALRLPSFPRQERLLFVSMMGVALLAATTLDLQTRREFYFALFLPLALGAWRPQKRKAPAVRGTQHASTTMARLERAR